MPYAVGPWQGVEALPQWFETAFANVQSLNLGFTWELPPNLDILLGAVVFNCKRLRHVVVDLDDAVVAGRGLACPDPALRFRSVTNRGRAHFGNLLCERRDGETRSARQRGDRQPAAVCSNARSAAARRRARTASASLAPRC